MLRLMDLFKRFTVKHYVIINKFDISDELTKEIEKTCIERGVEVIFKLPFSSKIVESISKRKIPSRDQKQLFDENGWNDCVQKLKDCLKDEETSTSK